MQSPPQTLRVLHTADWHIGKRLKELTRYDDFAEFLQWLLSVLIAHKINVLIVAGDVFDTMTPSNKAQALYYSFLGNLAKTPVRHVIIVAGNHDSPSFLDAPKALLGAMNIHVIGTPTDNPKEEVITLIDDGMPYAIIASVPYLRDKDVRTVQIGESLKDKEENTRTGIKKHYAKLCALCQARQQEILTTHKKHVPIIATGHLFAIGAQRAGEDDGMRELYVGTLGAVGADCFDGFDYVALGHIHKAQKVGGFDHIRYSGSPMMFNFGETGQKSVLLIEFKNNTPAITPLPTPIFRQMIAIKGNFEELCHALIDLVKNHQNSPKAIWVKAEYTGKEVIPNLSEQLNQLVQNTSIVLVLIVSSGYRQTTYHSQTPLDLSQLTPTDVFTKRLSDEGITGELHFELMDAYHHLLQNLQENDQFAE